MNQREKEELQARLILGGMDTDGAIKAVNILSTQTQKGISPETQARIDRANASTKPGKTWNTYGGVL